MPRPNSLRDNPIRAQPIFSLLLPSGNDSPIRRSVSGGRRTVLQSQNRNSRNIPCAQPFLTLQMFIGMTASIGLLRQLNPFLLIDLHTVCLLKHNHIIFRYLRTLEEKITGWHTGNTPSSSFSLGYISPP